LVTDGSEERFRDNVRFGGAVDEAMDEADRAAGVADSLLEPDDGFVGARSRVGGERGVFGSAAGGPGGGERKEGEESVARAWYV